MRLIGTNRAVYDRASGATVQSSTNMLTGLTIVTVDGTPEVSVTPGRKKGKARFEFIESVTLS